MRANVQDPQRRVGLHDLKFLGILVKEVTVSEQYVHVDSDDGNLVVSARESRACLQLHEALACKIRWNSVACVAARLLQLPDPIPQLVRTLVLTTACTVSVSVDLPVA